MFFDIKTAKTFQIGLDKRRYFVNFRIAPYFKSILIEKIKESKCYIMSFDESLKDMTQSCEIDLLHRYFYEIDYKVKGRYYDSKFFGLSTSKDIQKKFNNAVSDLGPNKLFQIGKDGSNINLKFLQLIQQDREENQQHGLIDIR